MLAHLDLSSPSAAPVIAAAFAAVTSLLVALFGFLAVRSNQRDVEKLKSDLQGGVQQDVENLKAVLQGGLQRDVENLKADLAHRNAQRSAYLEYELEARKRLYQECGPLLFELSELAERALGRIVGLARAASDGNLGAGAESWMGRGYYRRSTYYRLLAPLAIGKLLRAKLTHVDLSLDPAIHWQYALCKQLEDSFTDDFEFAKFAPRLSYAPHDKDAEARKASVPEAYCQQGIPRGILDNAVTALIRNSADGNPQVMSFGEFESAHEKPSDRALPDAQKSAVPSTFGRIDYLFQAFHPHSRPILWRCLLGQAHLYGALLLARERGPRRDLWENDLWAGQKPNFDWRSKDERQHVDDADIARAVAIGAEYAVSRTAALLQKLSGQTKSS